MKAVRLQPDSGPAALPKGMGACFMISSATPPLLAATPSHEVIRKDQLKELERVVSASEGGRADDYAAYVLLPMVLIGGAILLARRVFLS